VAGRHLGWSALLLRLRLLLLLAGFYLGSTATDASVAC